MVQRDVTLELGADDTTAPQVTEALVLGRGVVAPACRCPTCASLVAASWRVWNTSLTALTVPYRQLSSLEVFGSSRLASTELLPSAPDGANLSSLVIEQENMHLRLWTWPEGPMNTVVIGAKTDVEFL